MSLNLTREERRAAQRHMRKENSSFTRNLTLVPRDKWPEGTPPSLVDVYRSCDYLVQVFEAPAPAVCRLSVLRTAIDGNTWKADIPWEELQRVKGEVGYGDMDAVEVFPPDRDVINVAAIRHIWVLSEPLPFVWRR